MKYQTCTFSIETESYEIRSKRIYKNEGQARLFADAALSKFFTEDYYELKKKEEEIIKIIPVFRR